MGSDVEWDIHLSFHSQYQPIAIKIQKWLCKRGLKMCTICINAPDMSGLTNCIRKSRILLVCLSESYRQSEDCMKELKFASRNGKVIIPVMLEKELSSSGADGFNHFASLVQHYITYEVYGQYYDTQFDGAMQKLFEEISLHIDREVQVQGAKPTTTIGERTRTSLEWSNNASKQGLEPEVGYASKTASKRGMESEVSYASKTGSNRGMESEVGYASTTASKRGMESEVDYASKTSSNRGMESEVGYASKTASKRGMEPEVGYASKTASKRGMESEVGYASKIASKRGIESEVGYASKTASKRGMESEVGYASTTASKRGMESEVDNVSKTSSNRGMESEVGYASKIASKRGVESEVDYASKIASKRGMESEVGHASKTESKRGLESEVNYASKIASKRGMGSEVSYASKTALKRDMESEVGYASKSASKRGMESEVGDASKTASKRGVESEVSYASKIASKRGMESEVGYASKTGSNRGMESEVGYASKIASKRGMESAVDSTSKSASKQGMESEVGHASKTESKRGMGSEVSYASKTGSKRGMGSEVSYASKTALKRDMESEVGYASKTASKRGMESEVDSTSKRGMESEVNSTSKRGMESEVESTSKRGMESEVNSTSKRGMESEVESTSKSASKQGMESEVDSTSKRGVESEGGYASKTASKRGVESEVGYASKTASKRGMELEESYASATASNRGMESEVDSTSKSASKRDDRSMRRKVKFSSGSTDRGEKESEELLEINSMLLLEAPYNEAKLAVVGASGQGKSELINSLLGNEFNSGSKTNDNFKFKELVCCVRDGRIWEQSEEDVLLNLLCHFYVKLHQSEEADEKEVKEDEEEKNNGEYDGENEVESIDEDILLQLQESRIYKTFSYLKRTNLKEVQRRSDDLEKETVLKVFKTGGEKQFSCTQNNLLPKDSLNLVVSKLEDSVDDIEKPLSNDAKENMMEESALDYAKCWKLLSENNLNDCLYVFNNKPDELNIDDFYSVLDDEDMRNKSCLVQNSPPRAGIPHLMERILESLKESKQMIPFRYLLLVLLLKKDNKTSMEKESLKELKKKCKIPESECDNVDDFLKHNNFVVEPSDVLDDVPNDKYVITNPNKFYETLTDSYNQADIGMNLTDLDCDQREGSLEKTECSLQDPATVSNSIEDVENELLNTYHNVETNKQYFLHEELFKKIITEISSDAEVLCAEQKKYSLTFTNYSGLWYVLRYKKQVIDGKSGYFMSMALSKQPRSARGEGAEYISEHVKDLEQFSCNSVRVKIARVSKRVLCRFYRVVEKQIAITYYSYERSQLKQHEASAAFYPASIQVWFEPHLEIASCRPSRLLLLEGGDSRKTDIVSVTTLMLINYCVYLHSLPEELLNGRTLSTLLERKNKCCEFRKTTPYPQIHELFDVVVASAHASFSAVALARNKMNPMQVMKRAVLLNESIYPTNICQKLKGSLHRLFTEKPLCNEDKLHEIVKGEFKSDVPNTPLIAVANNQVNLFSATDKRTLVRSSKSTDSKIKSIMKRSFMEDRVKPSDSTTGCGLDLLADVFQESVEDALVLSVCGGGDDSKGWYEQTKSLRNAVRLNPQSNVMSGIYTHEETKTAEETAKRYMKSLKEAASAHHDKIFVDKNKLGIVMFEVDGITSEYHYDKKMFSCHANSCDEIIVEFNTNIGEPQSVIAGNVVELNHVNSSVKLTLESEKPVQIYCVKWFSKRLKLLVKEKAEYGEIRRVTVEEDGILLTELSLKVDGPKAYRELIWRTGSNIFAKNISISETDGKELIRSMANDNSSETSKVHEINFRFSCLSGHDCIVNAITDGSEVPSPKEQKEPEVQCFQCQESVELYYYKYNDPLEQQRNRQKRKMMKGEQQFPYCWSCLPTIAPNNLVRKRPVNVKSISFECVGQNAKILEHTLTVQDSKTAKHPYNTLLCLKIQTEKWSRDEIELRFSYDGNHISGSPLIIKHSGKSPGILERYQRTHPSTTNSLQVTTMDEIIQSVKRDSKTPNKNMDNEKYLLEYIAATKTKVVLLSYCHRFDEDFVSQKHHVVYPEKEYFWETVYLRLSELGRFSETVHQANRRIERDAKHKNTMLESFLVSLQDIKKYRNESLAQLKSKLKTQLRKDEDFYKDFFGWFDLQGESSCEKMKIDLIALVQAYNVKVVLQSHCPLKQEYYIRHKHHVVQPWQQSGPLDGTVFMNLDDINPEAVEG